MLSYDPQMLVLSNLVREVQAEYSVAFRQHTIHVNIDIESILEQLNRRLSLYANHYKEETGASYRQSHRLADSIKDATVVLHFGPHTIEAERNYTISQVQVDNGYKIKE